MIWALPVVIFIAISTALITQTNMKSYIVWSIDPMMKHIGLTGYDIVPVIEGFGCNAAAVVNASHNCNACSKSNCVSLISFGSSCSYQIGATASLFSVMHLPWLLLPYLFFIFMGGIIHTKIWNPKTFLPSFYFNIKPLKKPNYKQTIKQSSAVVRTFLVQALPVFIFICLIASLLSMTSILGLISNIFNILLDGLNVPNKMSSGILFSMIRKDGMLLFNMENGDILRSIPPSSAFLLILFSSTFAPCSVTVSMIIKKLGFSQGFKIISKQMITSVICIVIAIAFIKIIYYGR
ncbi:nucleoside recognition domain-containing protein [Staphylococcus aureus]